MPRLNKITPSRRLITPAARAAEIRPFSPPFNPNPAKTNLNYK